LKRVKKALSIISVVVLITRFVVAFAKHEFPLFLLCTQVGWYLQSLLVWVVVVARELWLLLVVEWIIVEIQLLWFKLWVQSWSRSSINVIVRCRGQKGIIVDIDVVSISCLLIVDF